MRYNIIWREDAFPICLAVASAIGEVAIIVKLLLRGVGESWFELVLPIAVGMFFLGFFLQVHQNARVRKCPKCAAPMERLPLGPRQTRHMLRCPQCGFEKWTRVVTGSPSVGSKDEADPIRVWEEGD